MHTLKTLVVLILSQFFLSTVVLGETFYGTSVTYSDQALDAGFETYEVFSLDYLEIFNYVQNQEDKDFELNLQLDDSHIWELTLMEHDMRHEEYTNVEMTPQGNITQPRRDCITYAGYRDMNELSRFTIADYLLIGMVRVNGETLFIEPLSKFSYGAPDNYFVVYNSKNIVVDSDVSCGYSDALDHQVDPTSLPSTESTVNCREVDFALAADFLEFQNLGSFNATVDHLLSITSFMEALYDDFDLDYIVRTVFVATSAAADPWTSSLSTDDLLPDFSSWGPSGFGVTHDIGQLWTNRNISGCGTGSGLIGCAWIATVCNSNRYNVCEDWSSSMSCLSSLSAHELGHNWSATHTNLIMNSSIICSATTWNASNITQINNHINSRGCLTNCNTACPSNYTLIDWINSGTWKYEASSSIFSTGEISGSADVIYDAAAVITLSSGFSAAPGSGGSFNAVIDGCGGSLVPDEDVSRLQPVVENNLSAIQVAPNPFSGATSIRLHLDSDAFATVEIIDITGKRVSEILAKSMLTAGDHTLQWDSKDFPQGTYLLRVVIEGEVLTEILSVAR